MPQMAPIYWLTLFFMFIIIFMMFNSLNYFSFLYKNQVYPQSMNKNKINWKW